MRKGGEGSNYFFAIGAVLILTLGLANFLIPRFQNRTVPSTSVQPIGLSQTALVSGSALGSAQSAPANDFDLAFLDKNSLIGSVSLDSFPIARPSSVTKSMNGAAHSAQNSIAEIAAQFGLSPRAIEVLIRQ